MLGIGIDTGGTCTDAVIYDFNTNKVLGAGKALTTKSHLETGIANALDTLPQELLAKAETLALSTTLATNACVENKGARARLLMIGFDAAMVERLKDIYASYGFRDLTQFIILDAKAENLFPDAFDPDWEELRRRAPEYFSGCDSVGIVQKHPTANGGRFEMTALQILKEELSLPLTIAYEISSETDILKTCAGTLLNARLIPLISEFMDAVHHVCTDRNLHVPISIVRSDGTLMSEDMAKTYPVETLLCGPAASVIGGTALSGKEDGVIVDMGGTTTDIAIVQNMTPLTADTGISIGRWKTMVKGIFVDTFGLGGDSAVRFADHELYLDPVRIIPISILASQYDHVLPDLQRLAKRKNPHTRWIHEFYVLQKDISGKEGYTEQEQEICRILKEKPLITMDLAERLKREPHYLDLSRLMENGVLMKSGLTPTDMMILKGDFDQYDKSAAEAALLCLKPNIRIPLEEVPDAVYRLVVKKLYMNLGRILLQKQYPKQKAFYASDAAKPLLESFYQQAVMQIYTDTEEEAPEYASLSLTCPLPLIGVGAPTHIFLKSAAELLHTTACIPEYAGVANALGAASCRLLARCELTVKAEYAHCCLQGFSIFEDGQRHFFKKQEAAVDFGKAAATRLVTKRALLQGIKKPECTLSLRENRLGHTSTGLILEIVIQASAKESK